VLIICAFLDFGHFEHYSESFPASVDDFVIRIIWAIYAFYCSQNETYRYFFVIYKAILDCLKSEQGITVRHGRITVLAVILTTLKNQCDCRAVVVWLKKVDTSLMMHAE
jgi:hypothetical protein